MKRILLAACLLFGVSAAEAGVGHWNDFSKSQKHLRHAPGPESRAYVPPGGHWNDFSRSQDHLRRSPGRESRAYVPPGGHWNDYSRSQDHLRGHRGDSYRSSRSCRYSRYECAEARYGSRMWHECRRFGY